MTSREARPDGIRATAATTRCDVTEQTQTDDVMNSTRLAELVRRANMARCPQQPDIRRAAFAPETTGVFVDGVDEAFRFRADHFDSVGSTPVLRAFLSGVGTGKTTALVRALLLQAPAHGCKTIEYTTAAELSRKHRALNNHTALWERWCCADALAIDELGNDEYPHAVTDLLLDRWASGGVTFIAGCLLERDVASRYIESRMAGPLLRDRIRGQAQAGLSFFVTSNEKSRRGAL